MDLKTSLKEQLKIQVRQNWSVMKHLASDVARQVANDVREQAPGVIKQVRQELNEVRDELKTFIKHPRSLHGLIEPHAPWLGRKFLGAASNVLEPFTAGMGFQVAQLSGEMCEVRMPGRWRNQGAAGQIHPSAMAALGEFTARIFWENHMDLRVSNLEVRRLQVRLLGSAHGLIKSVFRLTAADREATFHRLRAEQQSFVETQISLYDEAGRLVAEVEVDWTLSRQLILGPGSTKATTDAL